MEDDNNNKLIAIVKFPKTLPYKSMSPIGSFYAKVVKSAKLNNYKKYNVSSFSVNPKDIKKLQTSLILHFRHSGIADCMEHVMWALFQYAPKEDPNVKVGTVHIYEGYDL